MRVATIPLSAILLAGCNVGNDEPAESLDTIQGDELAAERSGTGSAIAPVEAVRASLFTPIAKSNCRTVESNIEEGGYVRQRCEGPSGYGFEIVESDLRQSMVLIPPTGGKEVDLPFSTVVAKGAFNNLGPTLEWRGPTGGNFETLTVRVNVAPPEGGKGEISNLVVVRLAPPACIVAIVPPGPSQSDKARAVADATLPPCLQS